MRLSVVAVVVACVLAPVRAGAEEGDDPRSRHTNDLFGSALALDGDRLAVGVPGSNAGGFDAGLVHVYEHDDGEWRLAAQLHSPGDEPARTHFGRSVALAGDTLVVGATIEDGYIGNTDERRGAVYVYTHERGDWQLAASLGDEGTDSDSFGQAVALVGDTLAVASHWRVRDRSLLPTLVHVFRRHGAGWEAEASIELPEPDFAAFALGDGTLLVSTGWEFAAHRRDGASWRADPSLVVGSGHIAGVAVDGDVALVLHGQEPRVSVHRDRDGAWSLEAELVVPEVSAMIGRPALAGDLLAASVADEQAGRRVVLWRRQDEQWQEFAAAFAPPELDRHLLFGEALAVDSRWLAIGVPMAGAGSEQSGLVLVHALEEGLPEVARLSPGDSLTGCGCRSGGGSGGLLGGVWLLARRRRRR
ncbi:FG-GAP repeat protein [Nannocystis sp. SCPEA4]|uniref:FG-GAP repeat protein n=1 Tax=Nannocystis sp. SCPEA4 TaxID=2996787 RepID=UPI002270CE35|nr:FG-GAP repeat protein [Nannocystis sp. SCPEA4]